MSLDNSSKQNSPHFYTENSIINNIPEYSNQVNFNSNINNNSNQEKVRLNAFSTNLMYLKIINLN